MGNPKQTAKHLVQSPCHPYPAQFWRTGDYGYRDASGCLFYKGRKDHMVKIKGYRIELGEIESAISNIESLDEFCVIAVKSDCVKELKLRCYYSTKTKSSIHADVFFNHLREKIPQYMIPDSYYFKYELPKTSSGKIDRVLLTNLENIGYNKL